MRTYPIAVAPMESLFRRMIVFSVALHVVALVLASLWAGLRAPPPRFLSVAVVDLVGGPAFAPPPPRVRERPAEGEAPPPPAKSGKETKEAKESKAPPARTAKAGKESVAAGKEAAPESRPQAAETLAESIRRLREKKTSAENVREAVGTIRREKAARSAIQRIGERVAHRIDLSAVRPAPTGASSSPQAGLPGAAGSVRVPPEHLAYFRQLDERIRSNWTVPALALKEKENLIVQLRIMIEKDGGVSMVRMEKTSGNPYFDDSVLRAIKKASPLPVPPEELRGGEDHYEIGFRFYGAEGVS